MKIIYIILAICLFISCRNAGKESEQQKETWTGKEILIPSTLQAKLLGKDTLCDQLLEKKYKVLMYVDSTECAACQLQLPQWNQLIKANLKYADSLAFILVIHAINPKVIQILCEETGFNYPIFIDKRGQMNQINRFPKQAELRTYLLDRNNHILLIGNPVRKEGIWQSYLDIIQGKNKIAIR